MKVLELYSGIGGMHFALKSSGIEGEIIASVDINPTANAVYKHNFPNVSLLNRNIQSLTPKLINKLGVDTILMSPPCQPFTRNGLQGDIQDERTKSFVHILEILPELKVNKILIENVKGFENSQMKHLLIMALEKCKYTYQEFILSPTQIGIPNSRLRYYCLAKRNETFDSKVTSIMTEFLSSLVCENNSSSISEFIDNSEDLSSYYLEDNILKKYLYILDICYSNSRKSCCFTKAYGRYIEGTGSVFTEKSIDFVNDTFKQLSEYSSESEDYLKLARKLNLRFFTPKEISRLMSFPETFSFPHGIKNKQKYMLLGNSINVKVVAELIKLLS